VGAARDTPSSTLEPLAHSFGVGVIKPFVQQQRLAPLALCRDDAALRVVRLAHVHQRVRFQAVVIDRAIDIHRIPVADQRLAVPAEVVLRIAETVPRGGLATAIADLLVLSDGLLALNDGLFVLPHE